MGYNGLGRDTRGGLVKIDPYTKKKLPQGLTGPIGAGGVAPPSKSGRKPKKGKRELRRFAKKTVAQLAAGDPNPAYQSADKPMTAILDHLLQAGRSRQTRKMVRDVADVTHGSEGFFRAAGRLIHGAGTEAAPPEYVNRMAPYLVKKRGTMGRSPGTEKVKIPVRDPKSGELVRTIETERKSLDPSTIKSAKVPVRDRSGKVIRHLNVKNMEVRRRFEPTAEEAANFARGAREIDEAGAAAAKTRPEWSHRATANWREKLGSFMGISAKGHTGEREHLLKAGERGKGQVSPEAIRAHRKSATAEWIAGGGAKKGSGKPRPTLASSAAALGAPERQVEGLVGVSKDVREDRRARRGKGEQRAPRTPQEVQTRILSEGTPSAKRNPSEKQMALAAVARADLGIDEVSAKEHRDRVRATGKFKGVSQKEIDATLKAISERVETRSNRPTTREVTTEYNPRRESREYPVVESTSPRKGAKDTAAHSMVSFSSQRHPRMERGKKYRAEDIDAAMRPNEGLSKTYVGRREIGAESDPRPGHERLRSRLGMPPPGSSDTYKRVGKEGVKKRTDADVRGPLGVSGRQPTGQWRPLAPVSAAATVGEARGAARAAAGAVEAGKRAEESARAAIERKKTPQSKAEARSGLKKARAATSLAEKQAPVIKRAATRLAKKVSTEAPRPGDVTLSESRTPIQRNPSRNVTFGPGEAKPSRISRKQK